MNNRVQCFDTTVHNLGEAGFFADFDDIDAGVAKRVGGTARGKNFNAEFRKLVRKRNQIMFVGNANERPPHRKH